MKSRWFELKSTAIALRKKGFSLKDVETKLGIPRSTLSGWFKDVELTLDQKQKLNQRWRQNLVKARKEAVRWHNETKFERVKKSERAAEDVLSQLNLKDKNILDLALAILYLAEGAKKTSVTSLGNSDPIILRFFIYTLKLIYNMTAQQFRCDLHLRADHDIDEMKKFWSKELDLPLENFRNVSVDKRTMGKPSFPNYKGVCVVVCGGVAIQRKLVYLSKTYCQKVLNVKKGD